MTSCYKNNSSKLKHPSQAVGHEGVGEEGLNLNVFSTPPATGTEILNSVVVKIIILAPSIPNTSCVPVL